MRIEIRPAGTDLTTKSCCLAYFACFRFVLFFILFSFVSPWVYPKGISRRGVRPVTHAVRSVSGVACSSNPRPNSPESMNTYTTRCVDSFKWKALGRTGVQQNIWSRQNGHSNKTNRYMAIELKKQPRPARRLDTWLVHTYARSALPATGQHPGKEQKFNFLAVASQSGSHTCVISRAKKKGTD